MENINIWEEELTKAISIIENSSNTKKPFFTEVKEYHEKLLKSGEKISFSEARSRLSENKQKEKLKKDIEQNRKKRVYKKRKTNVSKILNDTESDAETVVFDSLREKISGFQIISKLFGNPEMIFLSNCVFKNKRECLDRILMQQRSQLSQCTFENFNSEECMKFYHDLSNISKRKINDMLCENFGKFHEYIVCDEIVSDDNMIEIIGFLNKGFTNFHNRVYSYVFHK